MKFPHKSPHSPSLNIFPSQQASPKHIYIFLLLLMMDSFLASSDQTLQDRLKTLIDDTKEPWTYAIYWQTNSPTDFPTLGWGDGYYHGQENKIIRRMKSNPEQQAYRKRVLRELNSLIPGDGDSDLFDEEVTDTEWFFLVSMTHSFGPGSCLPGLVLARGYPVWAIDPDMNCERAQEACSFGLRTLVCLPTGTNGGVVELGSTELIPQNDELGYKVKALFNFGSLGLGAENDPSMV